MSEPLRRTIFSLAFLLLTLMSAFAPAGPPTKPEADPVEANKPPIPRFYLPEGLEAEVWARAPRFYNPTNIDIDRHGRVWIAEAVNYRDFKNEKHAERWHQKGDRIMVVEDTDGDGRADDSHVFVQDEDLVAPLGVAVFGNKIVVSCSPNILMYTDVNRNARFEPDIDKKEKFLTGFDGLDHDHGVHAMTAGPGGQWHFVTGNAGPHLVTDAAGWTLRAGSWYTGGSPHNRKNKPGLKSDDGRVYVGGIAARIRPDGTGLSVIGHNFRNSYELCVDSFGNVWQNDNDDTVSCRTTWLMKYGNTGYSSADGERRWNAGRRPEQDVPTAHWRQQDPGVIPAGDVYGPGAPTGITYYENGALPAEYNGMLLSCEAGRNVIWGYFPKRDGAGFTLDRFRFFTSVPQDNPDYKWSNVPEDQRKYFRPSDVVVGPDGAIYVADWFDPIVGGHQMKDLDGTGAIYRITPKGENPQPPEFDLSTMEGQVEALKSPTPNVRHLGFRKLKQQGKSVMKKLRPLLDSGNRHVAARALYLLPHLGEEPIRTVRTMAQEADSPRMRLAAFRALRRADALSDEQHLVLSAKLAEDPDPAVRRTVALSLHDVPLSQCRDILIELARRYDGEDRWYLEAFGTACEGKAEEFYPTLLGKLGDIPREWSDTFADLVWRLHPDLAVDALRQRALASQLDRERRKQAIDTLAFIRTNRAAEAMIRIALSGPDDLRGYAGWWVKHRRTHWWRDYKMARNFSANSKPRPEATAGIELPDEPVFRSRVIREGDLAQVDVSVAGADRLYLVVTEAGDGKACDWADWAEPRLIGPDGRVKLTDLDWEKATVGWGEIHKNKNVKGLPLRIDGRPIPYGIGTHARSVIVYDLSEHNFSRFIAKAGLDNGREDLGGTDYPGCEPSVVFEVYHDGPSPEDRAGQLKKTLLNDDLPDAKRQTAAKELARSPVGATKLIALAEQGELPGQFTSTIADHIRKNPDLSVRAIAGEHFPHTTATGETLPPIRKLAKRHGNPERGRKLFFGRGACMTCHRYGQQGGNIGPDLTRINTKFDRTGLLDSIVNPSASIATGYATHLITTKDGRTISGFIVGAGDPLIIKDAAGKQHTIAQDEVARRKQLERSIMPAGPDLGLGAQDLADLAAFLLQGGSSGSDDQSAGSASSQN